MNCGEQIFSIVQQFGTSMFHMVIHQRILGEVENKCILHNSIVLDLFVPKIITFGGSLTKL